MGNTTCCGSPKLAYTLGLRQFKLLSWSIRAKTKTVSKLSPTVNDGRPTGEAKITTVRPTVQNRYRPSTG
jgi:hypothetical protein